MKNLLISVLHKFFAEYSIYWIYRCRMQDLKEGSKSEIAITPVSPEEADTLPPGVIKDQAGFLGFGADAFAVRHAGSVTAICVFWHGERYAQRNFWPLKDHEAKLVQIITDPEYRGRGVASALIEQSSRQMLERGFNKLYARIWHSNTPSVRAFERAGWRRIALAVELKRASDSKGFKVFFPPGRR